MLVDFQPVVQFIVRHSWVPYGLFFTEEETRMFNPLAVRVFAILSFIEATCFFAYEVFQCSWYIVFSPLIFLINLDPRTGLSVTYENITTLLRCVLRVIACVPAFFAVVVAPKPVFKIIRDFLEKEGQRILEEKWLQTKYQGKLHKDYFSMQRTDLTPRREERESPEIRRSSSPPSVFGRRSQEP